jgi:hypothetical protein
VDNKSHGLAVGCLLVSEARNRDWGGHTHRDGASPALHRLTGSLLASLTGESV